jgi:hypothetical protein
VAQNRDYLPHIILFPEGRLTFAQKRPGQFGSWYRDTEGEFWAAYHVQAEDPAGFADRGLAIMHHTEATAIMGDEPPRGASCKCEDGADFTITSDTLELLGEETAYDLRVDSEGLNLWSQDDEGMEWWIGGVHHKSDGWHWDQDKAGNKGGPFPTFHEAFKDLLTRDKAGIF